jgi:transcriptional antiterminator RfaH
MYHCKQKWYAIYTRPRKEDVVAFQLKETGIGVLNPKIKSKKYLRNKLIETIEPLFPCYLFANFDKDQYFHLINYTRGVRYILGKGNPIVLPEEVINAIKENIEEGNVLLRPQQLEKGDRVLIKEGPFKDFYGIFKREIKGSERVQILLDMVFYRLEIDRYLLKKV